MRSAKARRGPVQGEGLYKRGPLGCSIKVAGLRVDGDAGGHHKPGRQHRAL